jgi:hypothetical protein
MDGWMDGWMDEGEKKRKKEVGRENKWIDG